MITKNKMADGPEQFGGRERVLANNNKADIDRGLMEPEDIDKQGLRPIEDLQKRLDDLKEGLENPKDEKEKPEEDLPPQKNGDGIKPPNFTPLKPDKAFDEIGHEKSVSVATIVREVVEALGLDGEERALANEVVMILAGNFTQKEKHQNFSDESIKLATKIETLVARVQIIEPKFRENVKQALKERFHD